MSSDPGVRRKLVCYPDTPPVSVRRPLNQPRGCARERVTNATVQRAVRAGRRFHDEWTHRATAASCVILLFALDKGDALITGARDDTKGGWHHLPGGLTCDQAPSRAHPPILRPETPADGGGQLSWGDRTTRTRPPGRDDRQRSTGRATSRTRSPPTGGPAPRWRSVTRAAGRVGGPRP